MLSIKLINCFNNASNISIESYSWYMAILRSKNIEFRYLIKMFLLKNYLKLLFPILVSCETLNEDNYVCLIFGVDNFAVELIRIQKYWINNSKTPSQSHHINMYITFESFYGYMDGWMFVASSRQNYWTERAEI